MLDPNYICYLVQLKRESPKIPVVKGSFLLFFLISQLAPKNMFTSGFNKSSSLVFYELTTSMLSLITNQYWKM